MVQFCHQLDVMQSMKEQLEQKTKMIEANIQRQQDELRQIQEELQRVQGHSLQVAHQAGHSRSAGSLLTNFGSGCCFTALTLPPSCDLLDVPAERSRGAEPELHSDGPCQRSAAGSYVQHAGPAGVPGAPAGQRPASVPAANTPPRPELGSGPG